MGRSHRLTAEIRENFMEQLQQIVPSLVWIVVTLGFLWGIVRWAVGSAIAPLQKNVEDLRNDLKTLQKVVHEDFRNTGERIARVEAKIESTDNRLNQIEFRGMVSGQHVGAT